MSVLLFYTNVLTLQFFTLTADRKKSVKCAKLTVMRPISKQIEIQG